MLNIYKKSSLPLLGISSQSRVRLHLWGRLQIWLERIDFIPNLVCL